MYILLTVLIGLASILLILVVLAQNSKGGGLASNFSGSNQFMGVRKTTAFIEKFTWTLAIAVLVFSLGAAVSIDKGQEVSTLETEILDNTQNTQPAATPVAPAQAPAANDSAN